MSLSTKRTPSVHNPMDDGISSYFSNLSKIDLVQLDQLCIYFEEKFMRIKPKIA